jgi:uncharacterized protein
LRCAEVREAAVDSVLSGSGDTLLRKEVLGAYSEIESLVSAGKLFSKDKTAALPAARQNVPVKALCLHVAHTCNMNCSYCFARQGAFSEGKAEGGHTASADKLLMTFEVGKAAIDFLLKNSGGRKNLDVDFFGGEPLVNFGVVRQIVEYARARERECGKKFRFTLTTNGVNLTDPVGEFLNREMYNVVLSLDGRPEVHDRFRKLPNGEGSYSKTVPNFSRFVASRAKNEKAGGFGNYYMRGTYTRANLDFLQDIIHMAELGFDKLSMEPVVSAESDEMSIKEEHLPQIFGQYEALSEEMLKRGAAGKPFEFYHYILDLPHGPCLKKRVSGCGAGTEYFAVTPGGELFPCHQFVNHPQFCSGNVYAGVTKPEIVDGFARSNLTSKPECADCWARLFCSGGCAANSFNATGDINGAYKISCELFRKRMECSIYLAAKRAI